MVGIAHPARVPARRAAGPASPRSGRRGARARPARGLTLIEITIALLVVGLLLVVALPSVEALVGVRAREEAGRIAGAIRFLYGHAALSGKVCRLSFNLDERQYWAECTSDRFTLEKERSRGGQRIDEPEPARRSRSLPEEDEAIRERIEKKAAFSELSDRGRTVERRTLPDGANVAVWTAHQTERYTKGTAYLYFFPQGHTERARIWVTSDHGAVYTLTVSPLNGRVQVVPEDLEVPRS